MADILTLEQILERYSKASRFNIAPRLTIEWRGDDKWVVSNIGAVLNTFGEFEYEPMPSNRDDDFRARTRFSLDEAWRLAHDLIENAPDEIRNSFYVYQSEIPPRKKP